MTTRNKEIHMAFLLIGFRGLEPRLDADLTKSYKTKKKKTLCNFTKLNIQIIVYKIKYHIFIHDYNNETTYGRVCLLF